ncbi:unnamed protein product [Mycena citricolor]|uniref:Extradiol ring-cleavage dioxygenase class III enzyme subunit B domain-containing protein n=1 Tax=Mycena citricolor TaxID=2018698 RepID=A0AAD2Q5T9_9AGAR|nr:unnamed protein product [Mycena citricolor]
MPNIHRISILVALLALAAYFTVTPSTIRTRLPALFRPAKSPQTTESTNMGTELEALRDVWTRNLDSLPSTPDNIPAFFFGHGSPMLAFPDGPNSSSHFSEILSWAGPKGPLALFLKDFGPALLKKYQPKGIVVFSAHWETHTERLVTDYGDENPLFMDYYGFDREMYELKFKSRGDHELARRVVELYKKGGQKARLTTTLENRGQDGRGFAGTGLDHGVFVPFKLMFGEEFKQIPIVQVSIDSSLSPEKNWALGKAVASLRQQGILVLSGGLLVHNLGQFNSLAAELASPAHKEFDRDVVAAVAIEDVSIEQPQTQTLLNPSQKTQRRQAMMSLPRHPGFRASHPREDHFIPLYVAGGAGEGGDAKVISDMYGCGTFAFGL